ncbi:MAG: hypothetical protein WB699_02010 [Bacteroidota bacterium]
MNRTSRRFSGFILLIVLSSRPLFGQFRALETEDLRLIYLQNQSYLVNHLARCFENAFRFHEQLYHYTPGEKVTLVMHDQDDYGSGGTSTIPWNYISICMEPFDYVYETRPANERMQWLMNHELMHVVATDNTAGVDRFFRTLFLGKVSPTTDNPISMFYSYLTSPRWYSPRWFHEGIAVFMETWMSGGIGRAQGGYDEMVFRTMVHDSSYFYDYIGLESEGTTIDFQIGANSYLYGTRFMSYLADHYGTDKLVRWVNRSDGSSRYFASQFEDVYGRSISDEWSRWISWEHEWQRANLDSIRQFPLTYYRQVTANSLGAVSRAFYDSTLGKIFVASNLPGQLARLVAIDFKSGAVSKLCDVLSPAMYYVCSTAYDPSTGSLFFTTHNSTSWRDVNVLDVHSGETHRLLRNARIGDLAFDQVDKSLWGVQHHNGFSKIVRIPPPYATWNDILTLDYGKDIYDIDISPDGRSLIGSTIEVNGRQRLIRMSIDSLLMDNGSYDVLYEFENNSPMNFVYSGDGRYIYGTTYLTGVSNVVRYDVQNRTMTWVTNTETGLFRPLPLPDDSLFVFRYTGKGFLPVIIGNDTRNDVSAVHYLGYDVVQRNPELEQWKLPPPSSINIDSLKTRDGEYDGWEDFSVASAYPVVEGYKVYTGVGARFNLQDPLFLHRITVSGLFTPSPGLAKDERFHGSIDYEVSQWDLSVAMNQTDFYDLFGPTKTSRKGYSAGVSYHEFLFFERPESFDFTLGANAFWGLERLPDYQNIATSYDHFYMFNGSLRYSFLLRSMGAVDYERGISLKLANRTTLLLSKAYLQFYATLDYGLALPLDHTSLWIRSAAGYSPSHRNEPSANFYFGGFGNNWVDHQEVHRYREYYSFPGIELDALGGTNFGKAVVELDLPPLRFKRFGLPNFYCTWARLTAFAGGLITNMDDASIQGKAADVGLQMDFNLVLFTGLSSTLSFGYAFAVESNQRSSREFMVSLKLL